MFEDILDDNHLRSWWAYIVRFAVGFMIGGMDLNIFVALDERFFWGLDQEAAT